MTAKKKVEVPTTLRKGTWVITNKFMHEERFSHIDSIILKGVVERLVHEYPNGEQIYAVSILYRRARKGKWRLVDSQFTRYLMRTDVRALKCR